MKLAQTLVMITDHGFAYQDVALPTIEDGKTLAAPRTTLPSLQSVSAVMAPVALEDVDLDEFDALLIPDGLGNPARGDFAPSAVETVLHFLNNRKRIELWCD